MTTVKPLNGFVMVALTDLQPSPNNPRDRLTDIDGLAASIREVGLIQPIIAQRIPGEQKLQIVAGHRRHAAAFRAGLTEVAVIVRRDLLPDEELLTMLVENGQRAGLDPIEEARALRRLKGMGLTDAEVARKVGRTQMFVGNRLALLSLPVEEQEQVRAGTTTLAAATSKARVDAGRSGECWESVIRADERQHLIDQSAERGRCVLCDVPHDADANPLAMEAASA